MASAVIGDFTDFHIVLCIIVDSPAVNRLVIKSVAAAMEYLANDILHTLVNGFFRLAVMGSKQRVGLGLFVKIGFDGLFEMFSSFHCCHCLVSSV